MIFFRFHDSAGPAVAITDDITGTKLPKAIGSWKADGQTEVSEGGRLRFGVQPGEIIAVIAREGYFLGSLAD